MTAADNVDAPPPGYEATSADEISLTLTADPTGKEVLISVVPPKAPITVVADDKKAADLKTARAPVDFVLTIDVSGSMGENAPAPGESEFTGLTVLDVVKHAAKTIITTMTSKDRVAIVTFHTEAKTLLNLTRTTEAGKKKALDLIETMQPEDSTNLWDGLKTSMNILTKGAITKPASGSIIAGLASAATNLAAGVANIPIGRSKKTKPSASTAAPEAEEVEDVDERRLASIFLLTDGLPNVNPPRGHLPMLKMFLESQEPSKVNFTINTAGFGYSLDSALLFEIARVGNGHFSFIPDSGMVGTNFVHAVANTYATYAQGLFVDIEVDDESVAKEMKVGGAFAAIHSSWGVSVPMGTLQYGQARDLVVKLPRSLSKAPLRVTARCSPWTVETEVKTMRIINDAHLPPAESATDPTLMYHDHRLGLVDMVLEIVDTKVKESTAYSWNSNRQVLPSDGSAPTKVNALTEKVKASFPDSKATALGPSCADAHELVADLEGQVSIAVKDQAAFGRWGAHYLLSLARSHQRQQCGNFKDPGLQAYGRDSVLFQASRDEIDKTFDDLPPPQPSARPTPSGPPGGASYSPRQRVGGGGFGGGGYGVQAFIPGSPRGPAPQQSQVQSMSMYNQKHAPCFAGHSIVSLGDGKSTAVSNLRAGDRVATPKGEATVAGVVKTIIEGGRLPMCQLGDGLTITPWHPVYLCGWQFPADVVDPTWVECDAIYSLILEENQDSDAHAVTIGGVRCVTMGHGVENMGDVRSHPFLSNHESVMKALARLPGKSVKEASGVRRDPDTGLMAGFEYAERVEVAQGFESSAFNKTVVV